MDYTPKIKKVLAIINENKDIRDVNVYDIMLWLGTTQYVVAKTVLTALVRKGILKKESNQFVVVGREYDNGG